MSRRAPNEGLEGAVQHTINTILFLVERKPGEGESKKPHPPTFEAQAVKAWSLKGRFSAGAMASPPPRLHQPGEAGGAERDVRSCAWSTPARPVHMCTEAVLPRAELGLPPCSLSASDRVAGAHRSAASSCGRCAHGARFSRTSCCARGRDRAPPPPTSSS